MDTRPLFIPVILGTVRKGRASENVAKFVFGEVQKREGVETELIDLRDLNIDFNDAGEAVKNVKSWEKKTLSNLNKQVTAPKTMAAVLKKILSGKHKAKLDNAVKTASNSTKVRRAVVNAVKWQSNVRVDRELVTGQNPFSDTALAEKFLQLLQAE